MSGSQLIAITGGTGFVGRHLVRELLARGHRCRVLARDAGKASRVLPQHADLETVPGDASDDGAMSELFRGATAAAHLIGIIRETAGGQTFQRIHVGATRSAVEHAAAAGVRRYLHMSALGASPEGPSAYQKTKFEAERLVRSSDLDWTIFRPGLIHGPDGEFFLQMKAWCEGRSAPFVFLPYFSRVEFDGTPGPLNPPRLVAPTVAPVHVDDVAKAFAESLERPASVHEVIPLSGPERITWPSMLRLVRDTLPQAKRELRPVGLPGPIALAQARLAKALGLSGLLPYDAGMAQMGERDSVCANDRARALIGFEPRGFGESLRAYAAA